MAESSEKQLKRIIDIAKMYYINNMTQQQIADAFHISRPLVSSLLARARELEIVHIEIKDPYGDNDAWLNYLKYKYGIKDGAIIPKINSFSLSESIYSWKAVEIMSELILQSSHIGLGWGNVIDQVIRCFSKDIVTTPKTFFPLVGSLLSSGREFHTNELVRRIAEKFTSSSLFLNAPLFPNSTSEREVFINTADYKSLEKEYKNMDLAIITVSSFPTVPDMASAYRVPNLDIRKQIVGEMIAYYYFDNGDFYISSTDIAIHCPLDYLRNTKNVLLLVPENVSSNALLGILKTGLITHIIIAEESLSSILV